MLYFPFSDTIDLLTLEEFRDGMGNLNNPIYMWGSLTGLDDTNMDEMLGLKRERSLRDRYLIPPVDTETLLSFFLQIGIHPRHSLPVKDIGYPKPLVEALVIIAESSEFSIETRHEAILGLRQIKEDFDHFYDDTFYPEKIEELWGEMQILGLNLHGVERTDGILGLFNMHMDMQSDPSLLTQRKFGLYENRLMLEIDDEKAKLERAEAAQKRHSRVINDVRAEIFGDDDGEFASGCEQAEEFIFQYMSQPKFSNMTTDEQWDYVGITLTKPQGVFSHLVDPRVYNSSFTRNVGEGRFLGWPELGHAYANGYKGLRRAENNAEKASERIRVLNDELDDFHEFVDLAEEAGDLTLYDAKHMVDALDIDFLQLALHSDFSSGNAVAPGVFVSKA